MEAQLYCLKGAVHLKVKSRVRLETGLNEAVEKQIILLQIYYGFVQNKDKGKEWSGREAIVCLYARCGKLKVGHAANAKED